MERIRRRIQDPGRIPSEHDPKLAHHRSPEFVTSFVRPPMKLVVRPEPMLGEQLPDIRFAQVPFRGEPGGPRSVVGAAIRVR